MIYIQVRGSNDSDWNYIMLSYSIRPHTLSHKSIVRPCDGPQWRCALGVSYLSKWLALRWSLFSVFFFCRFFVCLFLTASVDLNRMS